MQPRLCRLDRDGSTGYFLPASGRPGVDFPCHEQATRSVGFRASGPCPSQIDCACSSQRSPSRSRSPRSCTYPTATRRMGPGRPSSASSARVSIAAPRRRRRRPHRCRLRGLCPPCRMRYCPLDAARPRVHTRRARLPTPRPDTRGRSGPPVHSGRTRFGHSPDFVESVNETQSLPVPGRCIRAGHACGARAALEPRGGRRDRQPAQGRGHRSRAGRHRARRR